MKQNKKETIQGFVPGQGGGWSATGMIFPKQNETKKKELLQGGEVGGSRPFVPVEKILKKKRSLCHANMLC